MDANEVVVQLLVVSHRLGPPGISRRGRQKARKGTVRVALATVVDTVVIGPLDIVTPQVHANAVEIVVNVVGIGALSFALTEAETDDLAVDRLATAAHLDAQVVKPGLVVRLVGNVGPPVGIRVEAPLDGPNCNGGGGVWRRSNSLVCQRRIGKGVAVPRAERT